MAGTNEQQDLLPISNGSSDTHVVNDRCLVRTRDGHRIVVAAGVPVAQYAVGDRMAEAHAMVSLVEQGWADQSGRSGARTEPSAATRGGSKPEDWRPSGEAVGIPKGGPD